MAKQKKQTKNKKISHKNVNPVIVPGVGTKNGNSDYKGRNKADDHREKNPGGYSGR